MKRNTAKALIVSGIVCLVSAVCIIAYNAWDNAQAVKASNTVLSVMKSNPSSDPVQTLEAPTEAKEEIDGYLYIGTISIPSLEIELPVMDTWDMTRLKIAPCRYAGSYLTDDMVICSHNNTGHLGPVRWMGLGEDVFFTTVDGKIYHYVTTNIETLEPGEVERMVDNSTGWDLTIFTCNTYGYTRCAVRCERVPDEVSG
ncbi:MAG: sortase [Bulleidia sp.]|nr:sortase [Bulleidia sp.]